MKIWNEYRRIMENQRGAFLVLMVVILPLILIFAGLAVDLGRGYSHRAKLQNAADAAVMAAAHIYFPNKDRDEVYEWAQRYMDANRGDQTYKIDQITVRELKDANSAEKSILLSVYASELVPVSFMAIAGFDAIPVDVVATAKIIPGEELTDVSGIFSYAFIGANTTDASTIKNLWADEKNYSIFFTNSNHRVHGQVHVNGYLKLNNTCDSDGKRVVLIDPGAFSTSAKTDRNIWAGFNINHWEHDSKQSSTHYYDNDIPVDATDPNTDWYHMIRIGYDDGTLWGQDVIVDKLEPKDISISLKQGNDMTKDVYDYLTKLSKTYPGGLNGGTYDDKGIYFSTLSNIGEWDSNKWQSFQYKKYEPKATKYKVIVADTDLEINDRLIDYDEDHVVIISLHGDIVLNLSDNLKLKALVYAPKGEIIYNGCLTFEGSMVAQRIRLNKSNATYTWKAFKLDTSGGGTGSGGSGSGSGSGDSSTGSASSITMHKDVDSAYGDETVL